MKGPTDNSERKINASPTKDFFVRMITRDISLDNCILELIDNSIDGAHRSGRHADDDPNLDGFYAKLNIEKDVFTIEDNCGGISVSKAIDYAFCFGRHPDAPDDGDFPIGLYGIGMKRAIFKIGETTEIRSSTQEEGFTCNISVNEWLQHNDWEFDMDDAPISNPGTVIRVKNLDRSIAEEFSDHAFVNTLIRTIERDYVRFIERGFKITVNGIAVKARPYTVKTSEDFKPYREIYKDGDVEVEILAGMSASPPNSNDPTERAKTGHFGWFVFCNDRVVLAADKTERTVWGDERFPRWHPQYNGFTGILLFRAADPKLLPWTTTKRDIDETSSLYRRAITKMKAATRPWTNYTNQRKATNANLEEAKKKEHEAISVSFFEVERRSTFKVPSFPAGPRVRIATITYQKPQAEVRRAAKVLGNGNMAYKRVGEETFEYFMKNEVEGEE